jgi:glycosyltransferase involved in cell wall biosynthesis
MPRRDLFEWLTGPSGDGEDPEGRSYRSGFWATLTVPAQVAPGSLPLEAAVVLSDGTELVASLGQIAVVGDQGPDAAGPEAQRLTPGTIAICMATYEPELSLFDTQVQSLRAQTDERWLCLVSDGGSSPDRFAQMLSVLDGDPRFVVSRSQRRVDPYRNFERALTLAPAGAELIAPCDQDDRWYPDKLAVLRAALGSARLVYSDQRLVTRDGHVLRDSLWHGRRHDYANLASLLVANTAPGAAMLFRRELVELALPFPNGPGVQYHDHWLALIGLASGELAYVDRALYDYVQHAGAVQGAVSGTAGNRRVRRRARGPRGWRDAYFGGYVLRRLQAEVLLARCGPSLTASKRRALRWFANAERSPAAFAWLALRPLRRVIGRDETLGGELPLVRGIIWRWLLALAVSRRERPGHRPYDASFPNPPRFEQRRLRRWRAGG